MRGRPTCGIARQGVHDQAHQPQVLHEVLRRRLWRDALGDDLVEALDLVSVGILERRAEHALLVGVAHRLVDDERRRQVADIRRVVLDADGPGDAVDLDVRVEAPLLVDATLQYGAITIVGEGGGEKLPPVPLPRGDDLAWEPEQLAHGGEIVAVQPEQ